MPPGSRQRVDSRCRTVAPPPTLGPAADVSEGGTVPSSPADPAVFVDARTGTSLDAVALRAGLERCSRIVARHARHLTRLDAVLGDGDHGDNLVIGLRAVDELLAELPASTPPGEILQAVGHRLVAAVGGASGPLYGTACIEAGFVAGRSDVVDGPELAAMFRAAAAGLARRGRCQPGDKTILDTLAPAADAFAQRDRRRRDGPGCVRGGSPGGARRHALDPRPRRPARPRPPTGRTIRRPPRPGRGLVPAPAVRPGRPMSERADLLARIEALERESRRAFDDAQHEADALFAQYQLSQLVASGGSLESLGRSVTLEVVRLAGVDNGVLWLGGPDGPEMTLLASVGDRRRDRGVADRRVPAALASADEGRRWCQGLAGWARGQPVRGGARDPARAVERRRAQPGSGRHPGRAAGPPRARRRVPQRPPARGARARARRADGRRRRDHRPDRPGRRRAPGRPAQPGRRATARHRRSATRSAGRAPRCSAARSPAATGRTPARCSRS